MQLASSTCLVLTAVIGLSLFEPSQVVVPQACKDVMSVLGLVANVVFMCWCAYAAAVLSEGELNRLVACVKVWMLRRCLARLLPPRAPPKRGRLPSCFHKKGDQGGVKGVVCDVDTV